MADQALVRPATVAELGALIAAARADGTRLALRGGGSKTGFGAPETATAVDMRGFSGVVDYDPAELVLTVRPGTPLAEVEALLAAQDQMLAFDPFDHGPIYGRPAGAATIGGVMAAGVAGSRRVSRGGARDHLLGFSAVSGRGEAFVAGAKVTKNVTGYDLSKLACGSWGRLFALTELHVKTLPRAEMQVTVVLEGQSPANAVAAMSVAMGSQASVAAAAYAPRESVIPKCFERNLSSPSPSGEGLGWGLSPGAEQSGEPPPPAPPLKGRGEETQSLQLGITAIRLEGFAPSVAARQTVLAQALDAFGTVRMLAASDAQVWWDSLRTLAPLAGAPQVWRVVVPAARVCGVIDILPAGAARWLIDWAGGLLWVGCDDAFGQSGALRRAAEAAGGHADLVRASEAVRRLCPARHPQPAALAALEARVRRAFDPDGVFETGRFGDMT